MSCDDFGKEQKLSARDAARIGRDPAFSTKILVDTTLALDDKVCRDMAELKPDLIVADSMALWGKAVAIKLGIPFVSSTTTFAFNQHSAKIMKQSIGDLFKLLFSMPKTAVQVKRLQRKGYPVKSILDIIGSDDNTHTIVYTSPEFQPCSETFSEKYAFVGPSIRPSESTIEKTRDKLVYISMGTVNNDMLPQTSEQKGVARQVSRLGAGILLDKANGTSVLNAINKILCVDTYKQNAKRIADGFKRSSGAKGAAEKIIQVCRNGI